MLMTRRKVIICVTVVAIGLAAAILFNLGKDSDFSAHNDIDDVYEPMNITSEEIKELTARSETGDAFSKYVLSVAYYNGDGVEADSVRALSLLREAAEAGLPEACADLGIKYFYGETLEQDFQKAVSLFVAAADAGNDEAVYCLGVCYERGLGVDKNETKAAELYKKAALQGNPWAQCNLGWCYKNGFGVKENLDSAVHWYGKAAAQGDKTAARNLSVLGATSL